MPAENNELCFGEWHGHQQSAQFRAQRSPEYILSIKYYKWMRATAMANDVNMGERVANGWADYGSGNSHIIHNIHSNGNRS